MYFYCICQKGAPHIFMYKTPKHWENVLIVHVIYTIITLYQNVVQVAMLPC